MYIRTYIKRTHNVHTCTHWHVLYIYERTIDIEWHSDGVQLICQRYLSLQPRAAAVAAALTNHPPPPKRPLRRTHVNRAMRDILFDQRFGCGWRGEIALRCVRNKCALVCVCVWVLASLAALYSFLPQARVRKFNGRHAVRRFNIACVLSCEAHTKRL